MKLVTKYTGDDESVLRSVKRVLEGRACANIIAAYGLKLGSFLIDSTSDVIELASCCLLCPKRTTVGGGLSFALCHDGDGALPLPDIFVRTGLPLHCIEVMFTQQSDDWEILTAAYVYSEGLGESARIDLDRVIIDNSKVLAVVDHYLATGYELVDDAGVEWTREELVKAI